MENQSTSNLQLTVEIIKSAQEKLFPKSFYDTLAGAAHKALFINTKYATFEDEALLPDEQMVPVLYAVTMIGLNLMPKEEALTLGALTQCEILGLPKTSDEGHKLFVQLQNFITDVLTNKGHENQYQTRCIELINFIAFMPGTPNSLQDALNSYHEAMQVALNKVSEIRSAQGY